MARPRGVWLFLILVVVLGGLVVFAAATMRRTAGPIASTVLVFDVPSRLDEADPPYRPYSFEALRWRSRPTLYDVIEGLNRAADDENVKGLVLHVSNVDWGWARIAEVRAALDRFRESGKPVYASLTDAGDGEYLLASSATTLSAPPTSTVQVDGLALSAMYLHGTFEKIGVTPNFGHVGEFKSGVETFTRETMSESTRVSLSAVLDETFGQMVEDIAGARGLSADSVRALVDLGPFSAPEAVATGLIDTLLYDAEVDSMAVRALAGNRRAMPLERYLVREFAPPAAARIALVTAEGAISRGRSRVTPGEGVVLGSETLIETLRELRRKSGVRAVVLRIDSPGGDSQASDDIWREVERLRRVKPVVVSMSDYAASGGYYVAAGASEIVAQPGTLTGSIGIYGGKFNILGLYRKLGLNVETLSRGRHAEMMSAYRDFTEEEAERFQRHLETFYRGFVHKVAENRHRPDAEIDSLARGRVWTGRAAFERGLVDTLGGFDVAFERARQLAGIDEDAEVAIERWPAPDRPFMRQLLDSMMGDEDETARAFVIPEMLRAWAAIASLPPGRALAILPFSIEIR